MVATVFAYSAFLRRDQWEERSVALVFTALFLVAPLVHVSLVFGCGALAIMLGYYIVLVRISGKRKRETPPAG